jgi:hypothetical protein
MKRKAKPVIAKPPKFFRQVLIMGRGSFWCPEIWNFLMTKGRLKKAFFNNQQILNYEKMLMFAQEPSSLSNKGGFKKIENTIFKRKYEHIFRK